MISRGQHIDAEAARFAAVLAVADPQAPVPTCPGWTARDLLTHLIEVHQFWAAVIGDRLDAAGVEAFEQSRVRQPDDITDLLHAREVATAALLAALKAREVAEPAWSWFPPDQTVGFTWRMQTHEVTMHRVDAELTAGGPIGAIEADVAAEGVDHVLDVMWAWAPPDAARRATGLLELVAEDTGQRWLLQTQRWSGQAWGQTFEDMPTCVRVATGVPSASVRATVADLDLLVWTRADRGVTRSGDPSVLAQFQAVLDLGIQ
jgi:uncharacterized protein (TIGR03083 family)